MIDEPPWPFLMTPAQHRQWAANARRRNRPDLAQHHEKLAERARATPVEIRRVGENELNFESPRAVAVCGHRWMRSEQACGSDHDPCDGGGETGEQQQVIEDTDDHRSPPMQHHPTHSASQDVG